jgi:hypothetical protein
MDSNDVKEYLSTTLKWLYWGLGLLILGGGCYILFNRYNKQVASILVFLAGVLALYYYYVKWFITDLEPWPPVKRVCPDFLSVAGVETSGTDKTVFCVDYVGASTKFGKINTTTDPWVSTLDGVKAQTANAVGSKVFKYSTADINTEAKLTNTCTIVSTLGLSWDICNSV